MGTKAEVTGLVKHMPGRLVVALRVAHPCTDLMIHYIQSPQQSHYTKINVSILL